MDDLLDPDRWFCHYTKAETAFDAIIPSGNLRMSAYGRMRDPFESKNLAFVAGAGWGDADTQSQRFDELQTAVARVRTPMRMLSLSMGTGYENPVLKFFACPWAKARMWEQYAENHAGVCLIFDRAAMTTALRSALEPDGEHWDAPVRYTPGGFAASDAAIVNIDEFGDSTVEEDMAKYVAANVEDFFS